MLTSLFRLNKYPFPQFSLPIWPILNGQKLRLFSTGLLLLIAGCSNAPSQDNNPTVDWQQHQTQLKQLTKFKVTGKIGYQDPNHRQSLNFILIHSASYDELRLLTFFGNTVVKLQMMPDGAIINANGQVSSAQDANKLIKQLTGFSIPVTQLPDWIKGLPTDADKVKYNDSNTVSELTKTVDKQQWSLSYLSYQPVPLANEKPLLLPNQLYLAQNNTHIKIIISKWIF